MNTISLGKAGSTSRGKVFNIRQKGAHVGEMIVRYNRGKKSLYVDSVKVQGGPRSLGPTGTRDMARALKKQFGDIRSFEGNRVTGARAHLAAKKGGKFLGYNAAVRWNGQDSFHLGQGGKPGGHAGYGK